MAAGAAGAEKGRLAGLVGDAVVGKDASVALQGVVRMVSAFLGAEEIAGLGRRQVGAATPGKSPVRPSRSRMTWKCRCGGQPPFTVSAPKRPTVGRRLPALRVQPPRNARAGA